jgi:soluble lytic murein transglycosylase-like protein
MFDDRIGDMQKMLARMGPAGRQKYAADNANDPIAVSMALFVNNIAKELTEGKAADPTVQAPVVQQAIQAMNQPRMPPSMPQAMPQRMPPQGPQQAMPQRMPPPQSQTRMAADGGYMDSRLPEDMGIGALPERSLSGMADGGIVGYAEKGLVQPRKPEVGPYEAQIRAEAKKQGVDPDLMVRMFSTESRGDPKAVSPKGAVGLGQ